MSESRFDLTGIEFEVTEPAGLTVAQWHEIQALRHAAYESGLPHRSQGEIDYLTQHGEAGTADFIRSGMKPAGSGRLLAGQSFGNLTVALARQADKLVGYGYAADNVSGPNWPVRQLKMRTIQKRYAWLREIVVDPEEQQRGVARMLGGIMLDHFDAGQPVSAYTWQENPAGERLVRSFGLQPDTDDNGQVRSREVGIFGPDSRPAQQIRWSGQTVDGLHQMIDADEQVHEAVLSAVVHRSKTF